jgi:hypothetical protein
MRVNVEVYEKEGGEKEIMRESKKE